jgi:hypothetical protein
MIESLDYSKGLYYGKKGDVANAGAERMHSKSDMDDTLIKLGFGQYGLDLSANHTYATDSVNGDLIRPYDERRQ